MAKKKKKRVVARRRSRQEPSVLARTIAGTVDLPDSQLNSVLAAVAKVSTFTLDASCLWWWRSKVLTVVDGDTVDVVIDRGFRDYHTERVRLARINAWESKGTEKPKGLAAKRWLEDTLPSGLEVLAHTTGPDPDGGFGRWLAQIWRPIDQVLANAVSSHVADWAGSDLRYEEQITITLTKISDQHFVNVGEWMLVLGHARPYKRK